MEFISKKDSEDEQNRETEREGLPVDRGDEKQRGRCQLYQGQRRRKGKAQGLGKFNVKKSSGGVLRGTKGNNKGSHRIRKKHGKDPSKTLLRGEDTRTTSGRGTGLDLKRNNLGTIGREGENRCLFWLSLGLDNGKGDIQQVSTPKVAKAVDAGLRTTPGRNRSTERATCPSGSGRDSL